MIDPKQGPLLIAWRTAALSASPHDPVAEGESVDAVSETARAGNRPLPSKRQFSFVGS